MVKLSTGGKDLYVEFEYDFPNGVTNARRLRNTDGVEGSYELVAAGVAMLGLGDAWNKFVGRKYALARAFSAAGFTREERSDLWNQFFNECRMS